MKCKAERPWFPFANLWGPFSLPPLMASVFYQSVFLATWRLSSSVSQTATVNLWFFLSLSPSLSLEDNDLPFSCKSWTLHFSNVQLEGFNPPPLFFFLFPGKLQWWLSICSFACVWHCLDSCVHSHMMNSDGFESIKGCLLSWPLMNFSAHYLFLSEH